MSDRRHIPLYEYERLCEGQPHNDALVVARASDIKPKKVQWLWQERFPLGKCTLTAGEGGLGKSMV
jgi:hypothetical protein